jgi:hypothetical protein
MLSEYRQRFSDFQTSLHREDYLFCSGRKPRRETAHVRSEFSDLFTLSAISDLRAKLEATSEYLETERTSLRRLIAFATEGNIAARVSEISDEIEIYEAGAQIDWQGQKIEFRQSAGALANEADAARRRDLFARRADVIKGANDLRAERIEKMREAAQELGYKSRLAMRRELRGVDGEKLAERARLFLSKTESAYASAISGLFAREAGVSVDEATRADIGFLQRFDRFDHFFPRERMLGLYRELFVALGFDAEKQPNVEVDTTPQPQPAFCAPIRVPDEIKLIVNPVGGQANYREFLRESGHAQHFAWTSRNIYPEFRIGGDGAVQRAWGMLLENLTLDGRWLMGALGFAENAPFRQALAAFKLMAARRYAALLTYESEFHSERLANSAGARYAELMTDAVRARFDEADCLRDLDDEFYSESFLRGCLFESQLREYLKTQFGLRWWASRKAGETLIDLWNTGQRYTVEELAAMIGLGELDFDWLASELLEQVEGRAQ